mmetsp:Transcript_10158/g.18013  ORF Transcript_10158/g.18013 Transcript_10158/m.18013 type:complete len:109 (+) Transcript_10158:671-997(+)
MMMPTLPTTGHPTMVLMVCMVHLTDLMATVHPTGPTAAALPTGSTATALLPTGPTATALPMGHTVMALPCTCCLAPCARCLCLDQLSRLFRRKGSLSHLLSCTPFFAC